MHQYHHPRNCILDNGTFIGVQTWHPSCAAVVKKICFTYIVVLFCHLFLQCSCHLNLCYHKTVFLYLCVLFDICCIHPNLVQQGAYKWSEGAAPLVSPGFCQTTALIQDDCGCRAIPGWMGPAFRELQGPAVPLLS